MNISGIEFPDGDYYDCRDSEQLSHDDPIDAIEDALEYWIEKDCDMAAIIREHGAMTVVVCRRTDVTEQRLEALAMGALEHASESFLEEFGDPDGGDEIPSANFGLAKPLMLAALKALFDGVTPWSCDEVGRVDLTAEQTEALMRAEMPEWFDQNKP